MIKSGLSPNISYISGYWWRSRGCGSRIDPVGSGVFNRSCLAELLHGAKGKREKKELEAVFTTIPILDVTGEDWLATGNTLQALQKKGCTVPLTDVLIACVAQRNKMAVLTTVG